MPVRGQKPGDSKSPGPFYYRCETCGKLLGYGMISAGVCVGHKMKYATTGSFWEFLKILFGFIK